MAKPYSEEIEAGRILSRGALKPYPARVCADCGKAAAERGRRGQGTLVSSYNMQACDVCGEMKACTEPRDFGYPVFIGHEA